MEVVDGDGDCSEELKLNGKVWGLGVRWLPRAVCVRQPIRRDHNYKSGSADAKRD